LFLNVAKALILELTKELAIRYEFTYDGSGAFQPDDEASKIFIFDYAKLSKIQ